MSDLTLCGWRVSTDWPLPELPPWTGDDRPADVSIRLGKIASELSGTVQRTPLIQVNEQGLLRFTVRNVANYLVRAGREVIIDTPHPKGTPDIALFLLGSVLGFLCHQRGMLPLHASCVLFNGRVIALSGSSGTGKSTMAALLMARGAQLLSDDVTVLDLQAEDGPTVLPSFPRQKLWRDTLDALGIEPGRHLRSTVSMEKFDRSALAHFSPVPRRLDAIYHLRSRMKGDELRVMPLDGLEAVRMLYDNIYRRTAASLLGFGDRQFQNCASLSSAVPLYALYLPDGVKKLVHAVPQLELLLGKA
ncbi:hypothetical protein [Ferrovibrio sp.]|uniref:hypothetical protein n=1 Tax=Ferrovibrio sp. TaxID=1917215 RepID=UPI003D102A0B